MDKGYYIKLCTNGHKAKLNKHNRKDTKCVHCGAEWAWEHFINTNLERLEPYLEIDTEATRELDPVSGLQKVTNPAKYVIPNNFGDTLVPRGKIKVPRRKAKVLNLDTRTQYDTYSQAEEHKKPRKG
jgi:hypothetical protein